MCREVEREDGGGGRVSESIHPSHLELRAQLKKQFPWLQGAALGRRLEYEVTELQRACRHSSLPERELGEEYMDTCPDCGFTRYCHRLRIW